MSDIRAQMDRHREDVRAALADPLRACELLGLLEGAKREQAGVLVRCPAHLEKNPSCSVTSAPDGRDLRGRCFACGFTFGDVYALAAQVWGMDQRREFWTLLSRLGDLVGIAAPAQGSPPPAPRLAAVPAPEPVADLSVLWDSLPPLDHAGYDYLRGRGLEDAADACRALADLAEPRPEASPEHEHDAHGRRGCGGAAVCAACRWEYARSGYAVALALRDMHGRVVAIQVRSIHAEKADGKDRRFLAIGPTSAGLFGDPSAVAGARNIVVAEGMTDSLAAIVSCRGANVTVAVGIAGVSASAPLDTLPLRGKRVLMAADPDEAGDLLCDGRTDEQAAAETARRGRPVRAQKGLAERLRAAGAYPARARPPDGSDLASMREGGTDLVPFFRQALSEMAGFRSAAVRLQGERAGRLAMAPRLLTFGVPFLDLALGGIAPTDIVLLGGITGAGKSEGARIIAQANAASGARVHYFALEDDEPEIEQRAKYAVLAGLVLGRVGGSRYYDRLNFLDWAYGRIDDVTGPFEDEADRQVAELHRNLFTSYPGAGFGIEDFTKAYETLGDDTDLVVIDHFHYLDFGPDENRSAKAAMRRIRELVKRHHRPVLLVAHIRKADRATKRLIPVIDDFHGSSDVVKMATKAVLVAPASDRTNDAPHLWKTYISAGKCRVEGSRARYAACITFDARIREYGASFELGTVSPGGDKFSQIDRPRWPGWARAGQVEMPQAATDDPSPDPPPEREPGEDG